MKKWITILLSVMLFMAAFCTKDMICLAAPQETGVTTLSDGNYFNQAWAGESLIIVSGEKQWIKPVSELMGQEMRIYTENGVTSCSFVHTEWTDIFLAQVNADLKSPEFVNPNVPAGYCYQLVGGFKEWYLNLIQTRLINGPVGTIYVTLNENTCSTLPRDVAIAAETVENANTGWIPADYTLAGTCTTSFKGSSASRVNNIRVAAGKLNGYMLPSGMLVSTDVIFTPRTAENGYKKAGTYVNGEVVQGMGGGICQVSSTLYDALMNAGVTVTMRYNHSSPVNYLPLGMDATISAGSKDLQFRNDYPHPVLFETVVEGTNVTVNVYVKTVDLAGRSYVLWSRKTSSMSAITYQTVYVNGVETEVREVARSSYRPLKK